MRIIILAFIISISLHLFLFTKYKFEKSTQNNNTEVKIEKKSEVKFVKLKKEEPVLNKKKCKDIEIMKANIIILIARLYYNSANK